MKNKNGKNKMESPIFWVAAGLLVIAFIVVFAMKGNADDSVKGTNSDSKTVTATGDVKILKSEVTSTAKFYPVNIDGTNMEVFAVKASDGTIRTAFNTCQVCYSSGRGYYVQKGTDLECQNCGNRFRLDQIEKVKGGCNPVPILKADKTDDGTNIVISKEYLAKYKKLFANWSKS